MRQDTKNLVERIKRSGLKKSDLIYSCDKCDRRDKFSPCTFLCNCARLTVQGAKLSDDPDKIVRALQYI